MKKLLVAIIFAALGTVCVSAQTAGEIAAKSIAAMRINTVQSIRLQGAATEYGRPAEMKIEARSDGKALITTTSSGIGVTVLCWYGGGGWMQNDLAGGPNKLPIRGVALYTAKSVAEAMGLAPRLDKAVAVEVTGATTLGGAEVFTLLAVIGVGDIRTIYVRRDNFLPVREIRKEPDQGEMDVVIDYADFQTNDGVTLPRKITKSVAGNIVSVVEISSVEINAPVSDIVFSQTGVQTR